MRIHHYSVRNAIRFPAHAIMDIFNVSTTIPVVSENFSTEGARCPIGAITVLKHATPDSCGD